LSQLSEKPAPIVLVENERTTSGNYDHWDDLTGERYEFPNQYKNKFFPGRRFIYYKGSLRADGTKKTPEYFGCGIIGSITPSPDNENTETKANWKWTCDIEQYKTFAKPVPFKIEEQYFEDIADNQWGVAVREISEETYHSILNRSGLPTDQIALLTKSTEPKLHLDDSEKNEELEEALKAAKEGKVAVYWVAIGTASNNLQIALANNVWGVKSDYENEIGRVIDGSLVLFSSSSLGFTLCRIKGSYFRGSDQIWPDDPYPFRIRITDAIAISHTSFPYDCLLDRQGQPYSSPQAAGRGLSGRNGTFRALEPSEIECLFSNLYWAKDVPEPREPAPTQQMIDLTKHCMYVTNPKWIETLKTHSVTDRANFWRKDSRTLHLDTGSYFFFKPKGTKAIVGRGQFSQMGQMTAKAAWEEFGIGNGVVSYEDLSEKIKSVLNMDHTDGTLINSIQLTDLEWLPEGKEFPVDDEFFPPSIMGAKFPTEGQFRELQEWFDANLLEANQPEPGTPEPVMPELPPEPYTKEQALEELFFSDEEFDRMLELLKRKKSIVLRGPPGTGKTFASNLLAYVLIGSKDQSKLESVQFHPSYAYEDFVEGIRPDKSGKFDIHKGVIRRFRGRIPEQSDSPYVLLIDEINRGDLGRVFGELMKLLEPDRRGEYHATLPYSGIRFTIPENFYIIGTMNSADRSLALVDYALRRRFAFVPLLPQFDSNKFGDYLQKMGVAETTLAGIRRKMAILNGLIAEDKDLGTGYEIGHSYFVPRQKVDQEGNWLQSIFEYEIKPLLSEYWEYSDPKTLAEAIGILDDE